MRKFIFLFILAWILTCMSFPVDAAEPVELGILTDAYVLDVGASGVLDGNPDNILNTNAILPGTGTFSSGAAVDSRGIMVFDVSTFSGQAVQSATLTGWGYRTDHIDEGSINVQVAAYAGDGSITLADFDISATQIGTFTFPANDNIFNPVYVEFDVDVTSVVRQLILEAEDFVEFRLTTDALSAYIAAGDSNIHLDTNAPGYPKLILDFSPDSWVKVEAPGSGAVQLLTDYDEDGIYDRFFIQGVGYSPMPIGRAGVQWGDTNVYDNENILHRDFQLLSDMNANTIRIWKADNTNNASNEFPNFITAKTLDLAEQYDLKVIPGFWVGFGGYWQCTENGREFVWDEGFFDIPNNRINPTIYADIMSRWRAFVTEFKDHPAILFWAIGNENNYQLGNDNQALIDAFYSLINNMAVEAHALDPNHPVAFVNGGIEVPLMVGEGRERRKVNHLPYLISTVAPDVDIWGANIYEGEMLGTILAEFHHNISSDSPLWVSEFGIDAWHSDQLDENGGYEDQIAQAAWDGFLWDEIVRAANNELGVIGGTLMAYSDEWWKPYQWMCQVPGWQQWWRPWWEFLDSNGGMYPCGVFNDTHDLYGIGPADTTCDGTNDWIPEVPDQFFNEEWWGIMSVQQSLTSGEPDVVTPREVYGVLQQKFAAGLDQGPIIVDMTWDNGDPGSILTITGRGFGEYEGDAKYDPAADLDHDGVIGMADFSLFTSSYNRGIGDPGFNPNADFNHDRVINMDDFLIFVQGYRTSTGNTYVNFSPLIGPAASIISWTDTEIQCEIPFGVETGPVFVHTSRGDSNTKVFSALHADPVVDSYSPMSGIVGAQLVIQGHNFGSVQGSQYIEFSDGKIADVLFWSDAEIVCEVPIGAQTGDVFLVTSRGSFSIGTFEVANNIVVTGVSRASLPQGSEIEIYGSGFEEYIGVGVYEPVVDFDRDQDIDYDDFVVWSRSYNTQLGDSNYRADADLNHDDVIDMSDFIIFVNSYRSSRGPNFVTFGDGFEAKIIDWTDTQITCEVPYFAASGDMYVHVDGSQSNGFYIDIVHF